MTEFDWLRSQENDGAKFSMATALYVYLVNYHGGQWSEEYANLCELLQFYRPSPLQSNDPTVAFTDDPDAEFVYDNLVSGEWSSVIVLQLTTLGETLD